MGVPNRLNLNDSSGYRGFFGPYFEHILMSYSIMAVIQVSKLSS